MQAGLTPETSTRAIPWQDPLALLTAAILLVAGAGAWSMTGEKPRSLPEARAQAAPPLVLAAGSGSSSPLGRAAALLQSDPERAHDLFANLRAEAASRPGGSEQRQWAEIQASTGLALSEWRDKGSLNVIRQLQQLQREYPGSPYVGLHLGIVLSIAGDQDEAQSVLRQVRGAGWRRKRDFEFARRADDLLHPALPPGYPPLVVDRAGRDRSLVELARHVVAGDRRAAARAAQPLLRSGDARVRAVAAAASFSKDDPAEARRLANQAAAERPRDASVRLHAGLVEMWSGRRSAAMAHLRVASAQQKGGFASDQARRILAAMAAASRAR